MAQLAKTVKFKIIPTEIEGICIRDLPVSEMEAMDRKLKKVEGKGLADVGLVLFQTILCDPNGEQFEDAQTKEDVGKNLPISMINEIMVAMSKALTPGQSHLGN